MKKIRVIPLAYLLLTVSSYCTLHSTTINYRTVVGASVLAAISAAALPMIRFWHRATNSKIEDERIQSAGMTAVEIAGVTSTIVGTLTYCCLRPFTLDYYFNRAYRNFRTVFDGDYFFLAIAQKDGEKYYTTTIKKKYAHHSEESCEFWLIAAQELCNSYIETLHKVACDAATVQQKSNQKNDPEKIFYNKASALIKESSDMIAVLQKSADFIQRDSLYKDHHLIYLGKKSHTLIFFKQAG